MSDEKKPPTPESLAAAQSELLTEANLRRKKALEAIDLAESLRELYIEKRRLAAKLAASCKEMLVDGHEYRRANDAKVRINDAEFIRARAELEDPFTGGKEADDENRS